MRYTQTLSVFVEHLDRDPNGSIRIYKEGSRVRYNDGETGQITKITNRGFKVQPDQTKRSFFVPHPHGPNFLDLI